MAVSLERETTEYVFVGATGSVPATGVEVAFLAAGVRPTTPDWETGIVVNNSGHALWPEAIATGLTGDYYIAILVGAFGGGTVVLTAGDYQVWVRITDTTEQPVKIAPVVLTIN